MKNETNTRQETDGADSPEGGTEARFEAIAGAAVEALTADHQRALLSGILDASQAIDAAGRSLYQANRDEAAAMAETAAQWMQDYANSVARSGPTRLLDDIESVARRNPALFVGGAAALGAAVMWGVQSGRLRQAGEVLARTPEERSPEAAGANEPAPKERADEPA